MLLQRVSGRAAKMTRSTAISFLSALDRAELQSDNAMLPLTPDQCPGHCPAAARLLGARITGKGAPQAVPGAP